MLIWFRGQWSAVQLGCFTVLFLATVAVLVNDQRSHTFERAASIVMLLALLVNQWTQMDTRTPKGKILFALLAAFFTWIVIGTWFKGEKTLPRSGLSIHSPVVHKRKSTS